MPVTIYVVTAYRWGLRDRHSYVLGAYYNLGVAKQIAVAEVEGRGGKYGCEIVACDPEDTANEDGNVVTQVHYVESPYFGQAGTGRMPAQWGKDMLETKR